MKKFLVTAFAVAFLAAWVVPSVAGVDFSGQYRVRGEYKSPTNFMENGGKLSDFVGQRVRLTGVAKPTSDVTVKITIQDSRDWGANLKAAGGTELGAEGAGPALTDTGGNNLDLHESYVLINDVLGLPVDLKIGRQELVYGDQRLIGAFGWDNKGSSFDAVKLSHKTDQFKLDLFWAKNAERDNKSVTGTDEDQDFYGAYATINAGANNTIDAYLLYLRDGEDNLGIIGSTELPGTVGADQISGSQRLWTIGARLKGKIPMANPIDYTVELPYQFGSVDNRFSVVGVNTPDADISAWAFAAKGGITINGGSTRIGAEYDYATGDDNPFDADVNTFSVISPTQHGHYGMMDQIGWRNISAWSLNASHKINSKIKVSGAYWNFTKAEGEDARYGAANWMGGGSERPASALAPATPTHTTKLRSSDDAIGQEIDIQAAYKYNSNVVLKAGYGHFFTDDVIENYRTDNTTGVDNSDDMDYVYLMLVANF